MPETCSGQRIAVFQQRNSAEAKIAGIRRYGGGRFHLESFAIDQPLPDVLDDTSAILPAVILWEPAPESSRCRMQSRH